MADTPTTDLDERAAHSILNIARVRYGDIAFWPTAVEQIAEALRSARIEGRNDTLEEVVVALQNRFQNAPNVRTESMLTSFEQNQISHGIMAAIEVCRALKSGMKSA